MNSLNDDLVVELNHGFDSSAVVEVKLVSVKTLNTEGNSAEEVPEDKLLTPVD